MPPVFAKPILNPAMRQPSSPTGSTLVMGDGDAGTSPSEKRRMPANDQLQQPRSAASRPSSPRRRTRVRRT
jgi:hypothetical protein